MGCSLRAGIAIFAPRFRSLVLIAIVDYRAGNLTSVLRAVRHLGHEGEITDQRCLGRSRWILSIRCSIGEADLISRTPQLVKVCSQGFVGKLVQRALPGLTLTHLPAPPSAVSPKVEHQYFGIGKAGPCWEHIVQTRQVGVYVPGEIPEPEIGLHVVLES